MAGGSDKLTQRGLSQKRTPYVRRPTGRVPRSRLMEHRFMLMIVVGLSAFLLLMVLLVQVLL
jgi:hypothetical protein